MRLVCTMFLFYCLRMGDLDTKSNKTRLFLFIKSQYLSNIFIEQEKFHLSMYNCLQQGSPRQAFLSKVQKLMEKLMTFAPVDGACDLMAKKFVHDSLPPYLNPGMWG